MNTEQPTTLQDMQGPFLFQTRIWDLKVTKINVIGHRAFISLAHNKIPIYAIAQTPLTFAIGDTVKAKVTIIVKDGKEYNRTRIL